MLGCVCSATQFVKGVTVPTRLGPLWRLGGIGWCFLSLESCLVVTPSLWASDTAGGRSNCLARNVNGPVWTARMQPVQQYGSNRQASALRTGPNMSGISRSRSFDDSRFAVFHLKRMKASAKWLLYSRKRNTQGNVSHKLMNLIVFCCCDWLFVVFAAVGQQFKSRWTGKKLFPTEATVPVSRSYLRRGIFNMSIFY